MNDSLKIKVSIDTKHQKILDFYTKEHTLSKLFNILLEECNKNKPFKFKILKELDSTKYK